MAEYIKRDLAMEFLPVAYDSAINALRNVPAADVAPVVHGTWELRHGSWYCSNCGRGYKIKFGVAPACKHNYCPNCGAKMDGGNENDR